MNNKINKIIAITSMMALIGGTNFIMIPNTSIAATTNNETSNTTNSTASNTTDNFRTVYKLAINRGPTLSSDLTQKDTLVFNLKDENGISTIKIEKTDSKSKKFVDITTNKNVTISNDKKQIKIGADVLCKKGENANIRIQVYDASKTTKNYPNSQNTTRVYTVKRLESKDSKNRYFVINGAPNITIENNSNNLATTADNAIKQAKITFKLADGNNVKYFQMLDMNNTNEKGAGKTIVRYNFAGTNKTESVNFTDFSKLKKVDGCYKIQIIATDKNGKRHTETIKMYAKSYKESIKSGYKLSINRGPRRSSADLTNENVLTFNFTDGNGISKVQLQKYDETTKKFTNITNNKGVTISKNKKQLKIGADVLCEKGKNVKIMVRVWDASTLTEGYKRPEFSRIFYTVNRLKEKDNKNRYFVINGGPRILSVVESDFKDPTVTASEIFKQAKISIKLKDANKLKQVKIYDMNNEDEKGVGKLIATYKFDGKNEIEIVDFSDFSKLKSVEGKYKIQLNAVDGTGKGCNESIKISSKYYKDASNVDKNLTK